ncbi:phosphoglycerate dehydrogenase [Leuconostoc mesenteroides]|uniref:phosphoglycerate dehydrogenase n=1 Tax=Leuconostoc mesenteroides TaxID=1245 RepID=UPI001CBA9E0D|nr:phosphoglycerate dehydrogenase [Leuconostoc mesenteroides]MBZ1515655.1 phosphoglycerate dehydrogenase [Leuconostoc mesenteroides]MBZ1539800.1 phosphoglycerate dehydrogenase [Leuconostoc mesenteroides]
MKKVLVANMTSQKAVDYLESKGYQVIKNDQASDDDFLEHADVDGILIMMHPFGESLMSKMPNLKVVARHGVGYDNVDLDAASAHDIVVTNTPGANATAVAETAMMHILMAGRLFYQRRQAITDNANKRYLAAHHGQELTGKTVGLIGYGHIGQEINRMLTGFNVKVLAYARHQHEVTNGHMATLDEIYEQADFVVTALPATPETKHMINASVFRKMKKSAVLVNIGRGELVDERALVEALTNEEIAGAGVDVVEKEPITAENPLLHLPNAFVTPHVAMISKEAMDNVALKAAEDIVRVLEGERAVFQVN